MWSTIEINDTLQLTTEQWFPTELDYEIHRNNPLKIEDFQDKVFEFNNKPKVRIYKLPPVRNFLVHNINGKWLYWWLINVIEVTHDNISQTTSWKYKIIQFYTPEEMKKADSFLHPIKWDLYFE